MHFENVNLADLKAISEDDESIDIRPNEINIARNKFWIAVILEYAIAAIFAIANITFSYTWGIIISAIYIGVLIAYYNGIREKRTQLFAEQTQRALDNCNFIQSEDIPERPPVQNGYICLRTQEETYSKTYRTTFKINRIQRDIDFNYVYSCELTIGGLTFKENVYSTSEFKRNCLDLIKQKGLEPTAIKNKYGDLVWRKGPYKVNSTMYKFYQRTKLTILKIALITACILPSALVMTSCMTADAASSGYVYECQGPKSKVYHTTPDCKGLNRCSTRIQKVQKKATTRRACKICA